MNKTDALIDELLVNIDVLKKAFFQRYDFNLLEDFDLSNIANLKKEVNDFDSLKLRITDITTQILENFNKKYLDKNTKLTTRGSIESFEKFLKHNYHEETMLIEENIHNQIWAIYNIRTNFSHKKNRNYKKALSILSLTDIDNPELIWHKCIEGLNKAIENSINLIMRTPEKEDYIFFEEVTIEKIKSDYKRKISNLIKDYPNTVPYLSYLINKKEIEDIELANIFNHTVKHVRNTLFPISGDIVLYRIYNEGSTLIYILDEIKEVLKETLNNEN
ncbi:hypothetical protein ACPCZR_00360 [Bacillus bombysepticus]